MSYIWICLKILCICSHWFQYGHWYGCHWFKCGMDTHWFCESINLMTLNNGLRIKYWWQCWYIAFNILYQESTTWIWEDKRSYASSNILSWNWKLHYCFTISYVRFFCTTKSFLPNVKCKMVWEGSGYMKLFLANKRCFWRLSKLQH
jgi:hypothetical protein